MSADELGKDGERTYSDEEFALILRKAADLAARSEHPGVPGTGLTLAEMKAAASQSGFDPALVERAARLLSTSQPSVMDRVLGGPLRYEHKAHFAAALDEAGAAQLLSAVRINASVAGSTDKGHSSAFGMTWHDGGEYEALAVTAQPVQKGTQVSVSLDRRGTFIPIALAAAGGAFMSFLGGGTLAQAAPVLGVAVMVAGIGGSFALARRYWRSSTQRVRERISRVMDVVDQTLAAGERTRPAGALPPSIPGPERAVAGTAERADT
ncbi:MAG: hypothetical protein JNL26_03245 [Gemmatimonadetes bacterium]|nr:hypothetical protein [Gemmatimonadota bacterium]